MAAEPANLTASIPINNALLASRAQATHARMHVQDCGESITHAMQVGTAAVADAIGLERAQTELAAARTAPERLPAALQALYSSGAQTGLHGAADVEDRTRALARHQAASALSPEQVAVAERQVRPKVCHWDK